MKSFFKKVCPPILWRFFARVSGNRKSKSMVSKISAVDPKSQSLDMYWDDSYSTVLEEWGKDNVWNEIQLILGAKEGKVLDIACGTGKTITILQKFPHLDLYGFDISDLLIEKALKKGIHSEKLRVSDATNTSYSDNEFNYSYSIGSLEHFTVEGIESFIKESFRYSQKASFHMVPISRSGRDEGWVTTIQSYFNNTEEWWLVKFKKYYSHVYAIPSKWEDDISFGRWFVCIK